MKKTKGKSRERATVPQANDLDLVAGVAHAVASGAVATREDLAAEMGYVPRLGEYYADAAEQIGLIECGTDGTLHLTRMGAQFVDSDEQRQADLLSYGVQHLQVMRAMRRRAGTTFTVDDIEAAISRLGYSGETVSRRRSTIVSWLRWLGDHGRYVAFREERRGVPSFTILARAS